MLSQNTGKLSGNAERYQAPCHAPRPQNAMQTLMAVMMVSLQNGSDWDVTEPDTHKHTAETWSQRQIHSVRTDAHLKGSLTMRAAGGSEGDSKSCLLTKLKLTPYHSLMVVFFFLLKNDWDYN